MTDTLDIQLRGQRGDFSLDIRAELPLRGVTAIFGHSGSGKTTLLRAIAGLEKMQGVVEFAGAPWQRTEQSVFIPPERRGVGYVFQEAALLPHLSVRGNLRYAFARRRNGAERVSIDEATAWLGLDALLDRYPVDLSGGERQRVAIARALVGSPVLLLMDEPLAALDLPARDRILTHLERLRDELAIPVVYVTHAIDEVARLADRVAWLDEGSIRAVSSPEELFARLEVGGALGEDAASVIPARVTGHDEHYHLTELETPWGPLFVDRLGREVGAFVRLRVRARDVSIALYREDKSSLMNVFSARIAALDEVAPGQVLVRLICPTDPSHAVLARIMRRSVDELGLEPGVDVFARVKGVSVR